MMVDMHDEHLPSAQNPQHPATSTGQPAPSAEQDGADLFAHAARGVVDYLSRHTPLRDWSVSRVAGGEQVHVHVHHDQLIHPGARVPWDISFCQRMTGGAAHVVPDSTRDPAYATLPHAGAVRAYVGYPITDDHDELFGVLCGVDPEPLADSSVVDAELVQLFSSLLSAQLAASRVADRVRRDQDLSAALAETDDLTGLLNRRGWRGVTADAQRRVDAFGDPVAVAVIDLDGLKQVNDTEGHDAGDQLLRRAADTLLRVANERDRVARYGGDEFTVLTNSVATSDLDAHFTRFSAALAAEGISASLGYAFAGPGVHTLAEAFRRADAAMYTAKREARARG